MAFEAFGAIGGQQTAFGESLATLDIRQQQFDRQMKAVFIQQLQDRIFQKFMFEKQERKEQRTEQRANTKQGIGLAISGISAGIGGLPGGFGSPAAAQQFASPFSFGV